MIVEFDFFWGRKQNQYISLGCEFLFAMLMDVSLEDYKSAYRSVRKAEEKRGFLLHLVAYVVVNVGLVGVNLLNSEYVWFYWPLIGWGVGLFFHGLSVRFLDRRLEEREIKSEHLAKEKE